MAKVEVCFLCDYEVKADGERGEQVSVVTQIGLMRQDKLVNSICYTCFRENYRQLRKNLEAMLLKMKRELLD